MADKPILFSDPMVRAILDGRKTQTRRLINPQPEARVDSAFIGVDGIARFSWETARSPISYARNDRRLKAAIGDRLWIREACATWEGGHRDVVYRADTTEKDWSDLSSDARSGAPWKRRPSIFMPRWASRLTLIVTDVRVEKLQAMTPDDAIAEGIIDHHGTIIGAHGAGGVHHEIMADGFSYHDEFAPDDLPTFWNSPVDAFAELWDSLNADRAPWDSNPWIAAYTFTVEKQNIDAAKEAMT